MIMKVSAFIPIKLNNERLPGKNIRPLSDGTPLCHLIQRTLLQVPEITNVVVFCSDDSIRSYILDGVEYLKRPTSLDTQATLCNDIIFSFINMYASDIYVMANATSPFIRVERFSSCIRAVMSGEHDSAFACERLSDFLWYRGKPLNYNPKHIPRTQDVTPLYRELSAPYVFTSTSFGKYGSRIGSKPYMCECSELESVDIDYPDDFIIADMIYKYLKEGESRHGI